MNMSFGEAVKYHRDRLRLTQPELGARTGRDATRVSKIELGQTYRKLPDPAEFRLWASALETTPEVMLQQLGYIGEAFVPGGGRTPEMIFTSLVEEIEAAEWMPPTAKEVALTGIRHAQIVLALEKRNR